jgi:SynChlorMet cassette radical SAM/SPASM protein ScmF
MPIDLKILSNTPKETTEPQLEKPECGRFLRTIYFYLAEGCNLRCRHCWIAPKFEPGAPKWPTLEFGLMRDIIEQGRPLGLQAVKLTGGEPLIHPEIDAILDYLATTGMRLTIETNGLELTADRAKKIARSANPFISVSLDGVDAETHEWVRGVDGCFEAALQGARNAIAAGLRPQFIMSIMRHNVDQMEAMVRLAEQVGAESVKFNLVVPNARGERMHDAGETVGIEELIKIGQWVETTLIPSTKLRISHSHPAAFKPLSALFGEKADRGRCGIFGILGVLGNGKYALCGIGETVPELIFGDAREVRLADVWNNNPALNEIRRGLPVDLKGVCGDCIMNAQCLGSCVANNYYRHRDLLAPFWYCEEALAAGLFPISRLRPDANPVIG